MVASIDPLGRLLAKHVTEPGSRLGAYDPAKFRIRHNAGIGVDAEFKRHHSKAFNAVTFLGFCATTWVNEMQNVCRLAFRIGPAFPKLDYPSE